MIMSYRPNIFQKQTNFICIKKLRAYRLSSKNTNLIRCRSVKFESVLLGLCQLTKRLKLTKLLTITENKFL